MKYTENALNILTVSSFEGKTPTWISKNLIGNECVERLCSLLEISSNDFEKRKNKIKDSINNLGNNIDGFTALGDSDFPEIRGIKVNDADKPFALFYKGDISLLRKNNLNIAVIGVLNPDEKIELSEMMVTKEILQHGATIVSGLALGCDSIAHRAALDNNGKTIAILPCSLNSITPKENTSMANEIIEKGGLLVSEYYKKPESKYDLIKRFVHRDRLQALFSDAVLLAASYAQNKQGNDCGSRHAMEKAGKYKIKRAVIYNELKHKDNPMYDLNRQILNEDKSVIRIDSENLKEMVKELTCKRIEPGTLNL